MIEKSNNFLMGFPRIEIFRFVIKIKLFQNCTFKQHDDEKQKNYTHKVKLSLQFSQSLFFASSAIIIKYNNFSKPSFPHIHTHDDNNNGIIYSF